MAMEGLRKELAEVSAKSQAAAKRKMAGVPPLSKAEVLKVRELDAKPQWVYASLLALSTLLWRGEVPAHEYVSRFRDKEKFTNVTLDDLAPLTDSDAAHTEVWCLDWIDDDEIERLKAFIVAVWTFTVTSLSRYRGKRGLDPKGTLSADEIAGLYRCSRRRGSGAPAGCHEREVQGRGRPQDVHDKAWDGTNGCDMRTSGSMQGSQKCGERCETPLVS